MAASGSSGDPEGFEDRSLAPPSADPHLPLITGAPMVDVTTSNALRVADAYACVRVLADGVASLPLHAYRRTAAGPCARRPDSRIVRNCSPARAGEHDRGPDVARDGAPERPRRGVRRQVPRRGREIVQLGLIDPTTVDVELRGQRIVYRLLERGVEVGPSDILHIKGMSSDGLRGLSPVTACRLALTLSSSLQTSAAAMSVNDGRPSGILTVPSPASDFSIEEVRERWDARHGGPPPPAGSPSSQGDVGFTPCQLQRRGQPVPPAARAVGARGRADLPRARLADRRPDRRLADLLNVLEQNRAFVSHSLRPWLVRLERAISGDADLCPGGTYVEFDLDGLLRADASQRAAIYSAALNPTTGWMTPRGSPRAGRPAARGRGTASARRGAPRRTPVPDRPVAGQLEQRSAPDVELDGRRLRGVIPYNVESREMGGWRETIDASALRGARLDDLTVTVEHAGMPLGRYPTTLELEDRATARTGAWTCPRAAPTCAKPWSAATCAPARGACESPASAGTATSAMSWRSRSCATSP
jgi:phage portal protein BeeE